MFLNQPLFEVAASTYEESREGVFHSNPLWIISMFFNLSSFLTDVCILPIPVHQSSHRYCKSQPLTTSL